jgi:uncharacterized protein YdaU (DUF1376 family)
MNNLPYFPFYPADWLRDERVLLMSSEAEGKYIRLLSYQWTEGSIPADRSAIALLCKGDSSAIDEALKCFVKAPGKRGRLINQRLENERKKLEDYRNSKKKAGLAGSSKRWHSHEPAKGMPLTKNSSSSSSSSSSSNSNLKEEEFSLFWDSYPIKEGKQDALRAFKALRKTVPLETIARAFNGYMDFLKHERLKNNFDRRPKLAATLLRGDRWKEYLDFKFKAPL